MKIVILKRVIEGDMSVDVMHPEWYNLDDSLHSSYPLTLVIWRH